MARPIRSAQVISPFGVGAMMDFPGPESLIQAGLDAWPSTVVHDSARRIENEARLAQSLGVDYFLTPPPFDMNKPETKLPWLRFPRWHFCPRPDCGWMKEANLHDSHAPRCDAHGGGNRQPVMLQMRFVAACANGHLRDFPWLEWLAAGEQSGELGRLREALAGGARLRLKNTGEAGGAGVRIELVRLTQDKAAGDVIARRTLSGAFGGKPDDHAVDATPLSRIGVKCCGENPAIGLSPGSRECCACDAPLLVVLRGAGNLYFADVASAIHIPDRVPGALSDELVELFDDDAFVRRLLRDSSRASDGHLTLRAAKDAFRDLKRWITVSDGELNAFVSAFNVLEPLRQLEKMFSHLKALHDADSLSQENLKSILKKITLDGDPLDEWDNLPVGLIDRVVGVVKGMQKKLEMEKPRMT